MVWIHGGANALGASEIYDPMPLVETGDVVAVTINYRLGALGFLAHPALDSEGHRSVNYGIMDQQLALRWVQRNIDQFGGDPRNVTIFGESAGGLDVTTHVVSPYSAGLFHKAIIESGAYGLPNTPTLAKSEALGIAFGTRIGCIDQTAACLRSKSLADVLAHQGIVNTAGSAFNQSTQDGRILPEAHRTALAAGRINRVPVMQGANSHEGRSFVSPTLSAAAYEPTLRAYAMLGGKDPDRILAVYPLSDYPNPFEGASAALGDFAFACSARQSNQLLSQWVRTYAYEFADPNSSPRGAVHGAELKYLFRFIVGGVLLAGPELLPPDSQELAKAMQHYWTQFAWDGNPNSGDAPRWRRYRTRLDEIQLLVQPTPTVTFDYAIRHKCAFWD
jgi:para-nitrobenzyl esterase